MISNDLIQPKPSKSIDPLSSSISFLHAQQGPMMVLFNFVQPNQMQLIDEIANISLVEYYHINSNHK